jgi:hypothetical protein
MPSALSRLSTDAVEWVMGHMPQNLDDATGANSIGFPVINFSNPLTGVILR